MKIIYERFLKPLMHSWHFKVFLFNLAVLLVLSSYNYWIEIGDLPNSGDSVLYIVHAFVLKDSLLRYAVLPSIDMLQYAGIPVLGVGPLVPFVPLVIVALFTGEVFAYKMLSILMLAIAAAIMSYYTYSFIHSRIASFVAATVYVWNPPMLITAISEGHFDLTLSYVLIPLVFLVTLRAVESGSLFDLGVAGAVLGLMLFTHAQILLLIGPFYLIYLVVLGGFLPSSRTAAKTKKYFELLVRKVGVLGLIMLMGFLLASARMLPLIFEGPYRYSDTLSDVTDYGLLKAFSAYDVFWAMMLRVPSGHGDPFFHNPIAAGPFFFVTALSIVFLAVAGFVLDRRNKITQVSFALGVLAAFFTAGPSAPIFFQPFMWLYQYLPFYGEIRTPGRFAIIVAFFFAFLCGVGVKKVSDLASKSVTRIPVLSRLQDQSMIRKILKVPKLNRRSRLNRVFRLRKREITKLYVAGMLTIILISNAAPALMQSFVTYDFPPQLIDAYQVVGQQQGDYRFVGLPIATYYSESVYGLSTNPDCYEPIIAGKANLFGDGSGASYYLGVYLYYYLNSLIASNATFSIGKLLGLYNTKWILLHQPMFYNRTVQGLLGDPTMRKIYSSPDNSEFVMEGVENPYPLVYAAHPLLVFGGPESILALAGLDDFKLNSSSQWAFILANQLESSKVTGSSISMFDTIAFRETDLKSVAAMQYGTLAVQALSSASQNYGWWKNYFWAGGRWLPKYYNGSGVELDKGSASLCGSFVGAAGNYSTAFKFNFNIDNPGKYEFWTRTWFSKDIANLTMIIDGLSLTIQNTTVPSEGWQFGWQWINAGTLDMSPGVHSITMNKTGTGINDLDAFMIVPQNFMATYENYFASLVLSRNMNMIHVLDAHTSFRSPDSSWIESPAYAGNTSTGRCLNTTMASAKASADIFTSIPGNYSISIRLLQKPARGNLTLCLDGARIVELMPQGAQEWITHTINSSIYLARGHHNFTVVNAGAAGNDLDKLIIAHTSYQNNLRDFFSGEQSGAVYEYSQLEPGSYSTSFEIFRPSLLVFNTGFHPGWIASDGRTQYQPIRVNYFVNGYYINSTGRFTFSIVFGLNPPRVIGLVLTCIGLVTVVIVILYGKFALKKNAKERSSTAQHH